MNRLGALLCVLLVSFVQAGVLRGASAITKGNLPSKTPLIDATKKNATLKQVHSLLQRMRNPSDAANAVGDNDEIEGSAQTMADVVSEDSRDEHSGESQKENQDQNDAASTAEDHDGDNSLSDQNDIETPQEIQEEEESTGEELSPESFLQRKTWRQQHANSELRARTDPGDLADAELERIQLAESLDMSDETANTISGSRSKGDGSNEGEPKEDELDTEEMNEVDDLSPDSFVQNGRMVEAQQKSSSRKVAQSVRIKKELANQSMTANEDPGDLADAELERIQLAESLDLEDDTNMVSDEHAQTRSQRGEGSQEEADEMESDEIDDLSPESFVQVGKYVRFVGGKLIRKGHTSVSFSSGSHQKSQQETSARVDPGDLADAELERIQLAEDLDMKDENGREKTSKQLRESNESEDEETNKVEMDEVDDLSADSFVQKERRKRWNRNVYPKMATQNTADVKDPTEPTAAEVDPTEQATELDAEDTKSSGGKNKDGNVGEAENDASDEVWDERMDEENGPMLDSFIQVRDSEQ